MKVVTAHEMREIDRITIDNYGIPGPVLMERAGIAVASKVRELLCQRTEDRGQKTNNGHKKVLVLCGGGNNGGDGLVAARNLFNWGFKVSVLIFSKNSELSPDCKMQYEIAKKMGVPIEFRKDLNNRDIHGALIIDAVFGTGLSRPVKGELAEVFAFVNKSGVPVVSVDIPSGISSDTGEILGEAIHANYTVTFGLPKRGHHLYPGAEYTGKLFVEDIGFPVELLTSDNLKTNLIDIEMVSNLIPLRPKYSHKGDYGHALIIAGSKGKTGAALMAAKACLKSGAGLVTLAVPESLMDVFQCRVTEEMTLPLPDDGKGMFSSKAIDEILNFAAQKIDVIAIGPGMGVSSDTGIIMKELIQKSTVPMVIDADGINSISRATGNRQGATGLLKRAKSPIVITPHPGEMVRLLSQKSEENPTIPNEGELFNKGGRGEIINLIQEIERDRISIAMNFSRETGTYLVLKGVPTIVAEPDGNAFINTTGNPGMATAGSGDVLTGIIASLLGQDLSPITASMLGVYIHGLAGDIAANVRGEHSLIASDLLDFLPDVFFKLLDD